jgi:hypothetical protein
MDLFLLIGSRFSLMMGESVLLLVEEIFVQPSEVLHMDKAQIDFPTQNPLATLLHSNRK